MLTFFTAIFSVAFIEILLSIDNALVNVSLAKKLPHHLQKKALISGIALGGFFRITGLLLASFLLTNPYIKTLSALYLFWLAYEHLFAKSKEGWELKKRNHPHMILAQVIMANFVFSIDNILGVVGISDNILYIVLGVLVGVIALIFITPFVLRLMHQFPSLEKMTYVLLVYIGSAILFEEFTHYHVPEYITFLCIATAMFIAIWIDRDTSK